jgi:hypothetical protein
MKIASLSFSAVVVGILFGCASHPSTMVPVGQSQATIVANHVYIREVGSKIEVLSQGGTFQSESPKEKAAPINAVDVLRLKTDRWVVNIKSHPSQRKLVDEYLTRAPDNADLFPQKTIGLALGDYLSQAEVLLAELFPESSLRLEVNYYVVPYGTVAATPRTDWQSLPNLKTLRLNLMAVLPRTSEVGDRLQGYDDRRFLADLVRFLVHELVHVVLKNDGGALLPDLADEFIAHSVDRCSANIVYRFSNPLLVDQLRDHAKNYEIRIAEVIGSDNGVATTVAGSLSTLAIARFFAGPALRDASAEEWTRHFPKYCKLIVGEKPSFSNLQQGAEWVTKTFATR